MSAMAFWHVVEHYEKMKINEKSDVELFVKSWDPLLVRIYCSAAYLNKYLI